MSTSTLTPITSSLPPLTSSQPQPSSEPDEPAPRPAPRRTYGKARPRSPTPEPQPELVLPPSPKQSSPAKGLAHKWEAANEAWRHSVARLDVGKEDQEDDMEATKREMERMRREARGLVGKGANASPPPTAVSMLEDTPDAEREAAVPAATLDAADIGLTVSISSSSFPPSSPPNKRAFSPGSSQESTRDSEHADLNGGDAKTSETEDPVIPVKKPGRGKPKRVVVSDEESEEDVPPFTPARARSASTTPRAAAPPARKRVIPSGSDSDESDAGLDLDAELKRINAEADESEERAKREKEKREREEEKRKRAKAREAAKSADLRDIFSDEEDAGRPRRGRKKGLNQKDKKTMETDVYRAKLGRNADWKRPDQKRFGMTDWLVTATGVVLPSARAPEPTAPSSEPTAEPTSEPISEMEEITNFSSDKNLGKYGRPSGHPPSPSRARLHKVSHHAPKKGLTTKSSVTEDINVSGDDEEFEPETVDELMVNVSKGIEAEKAEEKAEEEKQAKLRTRIEAKKAIIASRAPPKPKAAANDSDSDLDITVEKTPVKPEAKVLVPATVEAGSRDPRAAINAAAAASRLTKAELLTRGHANKLSAKQQDATETYMEVAARVPDHAGMKFRNGGARPAGMKKGRDEALSQKALDKAILKKHKAQAQGVSSRRAQMFGKGAVLPEKEELDYKEMLARATQAAQKAEEEEEAEDEDAEDGDYAPDEEEKAPVYSGEEDGAEGDAEGADEEMDVDEPVRQSTAPPAVESEDDEEATPVIRRNPKSRQARVVRDSDDEDMPPPPMQQRTPVAAPAASEDDGFGGFDLGGFGSDGGSPGFSQLFGETQVDGGGEAGAFTQMRKVGPAAFLPTQAMLPKVDITDTQIERDDALIAVAMEDEAMERALELDRPKEMYLNEKGLYTQTKPQNIFSFTPGSHHEGSGSYDQSPTDEVDYTPYPYSRTQLNTQARTQTQTQQHDMGSPTQGSRQFTRLRRRASGSVPLTSRSSSPEQELEPTQISSAQPKRNAFDLMRDGARAKSSVGPGEGKKSKRGRNEYMEDQAEESDEDNGWGWAKDPEADDEDDPEEDNAYLKELVDDQKVDDDERLKQDELAAQKLREIEVEDDKRREAEARKIAEGKHRIKRRGKEFGSDSEDEEGGKKRWNKKQRKALRQLKTDEGAFLDNERNVFQTTYEQEHQSDDDSIGDGTDPTWQQPERERSITPPPKRSAREKATALREIVEKNRGRDLDNLDAELDAELTEVPHFGESRAIPIDIDREDENEAGYLISRSRALKKTATVQRDEDGNVIAYTSHAGLRSNESLTKFIEDESKSNRKVSSGGGRHSVVRPLLGAAGSGAGGGGSMSSLDGKRSAPMPHRQSTGSSTSSGIMVSRGDKFA
ncbi:hypothetical protein IAT38_007858 [Cryptococcus sp. DSM 104549]